MAFAQCGLAASPYFYQPLWSLLRSGVTSEHASEVPRARTVDRHLVPHPRDIERCSACASIMVTKGAESTPLAHEGLSKALDTVQLYLQPSMSAHQHLPRPKT